jgi:hypothetical protein
MGGAVAEIQRKLGAKPPKFRTKLSNFRHTSPFALEKTVFSTLLGQNFRKSVNFPHPRENYIYDFKNDIITYSLDI